MKYLKKFLVILFLFFCLSYGNTYADTVNVKVPVDLSAMGLSCEGGEDGYVCHLEAGFGSMQKTIGTMIKYFTFITGLLGVLFIIISGIGLSMSGLNQDLSKLAKESLIKSIIGVIILLLSGVILNFIAPWVYN